MRVDVILSGLPDRELIACAQRADRAARPPTLWVGAGPGGRDAVSRAALLLDDTERVMVGLRDGAGVHDPCDRAGSDRVTSRLAARYPTRLYRAVELVPGDGYRGGNADGRAFDAPNSQGAVPSVILLHAARSELPDAARKLLPRTGVQRLAAIVPVCYGPPAEALDTVRREWQESRLRRPGRLCRPGHPAWSPGREELPAAIPDKELRNVAVTSDQALCDWVEAARENGLARLALRALPARPASTPEEADRHALELAAQLMAVASAAGSDD